MLGACSRESRTRGGGVGSNGSSANSEQQQQAVMEMAKLGGRLSRAGSGSTVRNLKSAAVRINLTCTRVRVSPAQGKRRQPNHRITIHHQRQKDRFCLDWTLCRESGDDSTVTYLTLIVGCSQPAPFAGTASSTHFTASIPYHIESISRIRISTSRLCLRRFRDHSIY